MNINHLEKADGIGTVGLIKGSRPGPTVALRADIDALEITENTDLPYSSSNDGLMHAVTIFILLLSSGQHVF